jgi:hypothetical protein
MGVSTDAIIAFGIEFEEGTELPWDKDEYDDDINDWWREVNGFVNPVESPWDETGNYKDDKFSPECRTQIDAYFDARNTWDKANPLPVSCITHCSYDYPQYVLAVAGTERSANRGYPSVFKPETLVVEQEQIKALLDFCLKYDIEVENEPSWLLFSMWG